MLLCIVFCSFQWPNYGFVHNLIRFVYFKWAFFAVFVLGCGWPFERKEIICFCVSVFCVCVKARQRNVRSKEMKKLRIVHGIQCSITWSFLRYVATKNRRRKKGNKFLSRIYDSNKMQKEVVFRETRKLFYWVHLLTCTFFGRQFFFVRFFFFGFIKSKSAKKWHNVKKK